MNVIQTFYDSLASKYDRLFQDWEAESRAQAVILDNLFEKMGFGKQAKILDCACGIGTQTLGLAALGYDVTASDISHAELAEARARAEKQGCRSPLHTRISADWRRPLRSSSTS